MNLPDQKTRQSSRVSHHRKGLARAGAKRVEVTVPLQDVPLVKAIAGTLRAGGEEAEHIRRTLQHSLTAHQAQTGVALVAFLRTSPLTAFDMTIERDHSAGRYADFT